MSLRSRIGWIANGRANTMRALDALTADLQSLQAKVDRIERGIAAESRRLEDRQLVELAELRAQLAAATDDLLARVDAHERRSGES